ncbi:hypothetical protein C8J57DRAFT_1528783 [Mycena rebaudengoi]|nr:hypothetical protein C8J57DRAFT_1528783 [Mycena rebaudengoi]
MAVDRPSGAREREKENAHVEAEAAPPRDEDGDDLSDLYQMAPVEEADPKPKKLPRMKKTEAADKSMHDWRLLRDSVLAELLRRDGCGDANINSCPGCGSASPQIRCVQCFGDKIYCEVCIVKQHQVHPLHVIQKWDGITFRKSTLQELGLRVQLGHEGCVNPNPGNKNFVVLALSYIHSVSVDFCGCEQEHLHGPPTCATFELLDFFHMQTLQGKTTMYDFYTVLEKLTDSTGIKPTGTASLWEGARPERGPWNAAGGAGEDAPPEARYLYIIFLALDACFRLKRHLVSSELRDPGVGTGWAYFMEHEPYRAFLLTVTDRKEISTCSGLAALDYANTKFSWGYSLRRGVGMGVCARHELVQPTGVAALQRGERFVNMDYIFASLMRHLHHKLFKVISYDIACQWWKYLRDRLLTLPSNMWLAIILTMMRFVIPKMHIKGHTLACQVLYSLSWLLGAGRTDGEGIERPWVSIGGIATSIRDIGPGSWRDVLDNHWSFWNWWKVVSLASLLRTRLDAAVIERVEQTKAFKVFSAEQAERIPAWKEMVHEFERDPSRPNPYACEVKGLTEAQVRLKFSEEEKRRVEASVPSLHDVSPSSFIAAGLELEDQQTDRLLQINLNSERQKLVHAVQRFRKLQATYMPGALQALAQRDALPEEVPENEPLMLPSTMTPAEREGGCVTGLTEVEHILRDAQCRTALAELRNQLHIKGRYLIYKKGNSWHQGANTRSCGPIDHNEGKIQLHSEKYQTAWKAILAIMGGDAAKVGWLKMRKEDIRLMEDPEELTKKAAEKRKRVVERRTVKVARLIESGELAAGQQDEGAEGKDEDSGDEEGERAARGGEGHRQVSWIWTMAGASGTDADFEAALQIEWLKVCARKRRWDEEVGLLKEEMRRILASFEYEAKVWDARASAVPVGQIDERVAEGAIAYTKRRPHEELEEEEEAAEESEDESNASDDDTACWGGNGDEDMIMDGGLDN